MSATEEIDKLNYRMDQFYKWASQLQVECRNLKQRVGYLESLLQDQFDFIPSQALQNHQAEVEEMKSKKAEAERAEADAEAELLARMAKFKAAR